jgi:hypothetical protein
MGEMDRPKNRMQIGASWETCYHGDYREMGEGDRAYVISVFLGWLKVVWPMRVKHNQAKCISID